jgi:hypothetical protein
VTVCVGRGGESEEASETKESEVVRLVMARVPEGTRRFRLPSPRVQTSEERAKLHNNGHFGRSSRACPGGALKTGSCNNADDLQPNGPFCFSVHAKKSHGPLVVVYGRSMYSEGCRRLFGYV